MKEIAKKFEAKGVTSQRILCSSDPDSLDGIIIENQGKKIAIIDGTAPHARDPKIPGAIDKILNLGEFWNEKTLSKNKESIIKLSKSKEKHYDNAYRYLSVAGLCTKHVDEIMKGVVKQNFEELINEVFLNSKTEDGISETMLFTAFGKRGFYELEKPAAYAEREINVVGIYGSEYHFMNMILNEAKRLFQNFIFSPSPLDKEKIDSIYQHSNGISVTVGNKCYSTNAKTIDTSRYLDVKKLDINRNLLETLYKEREAMLWCATDEFKKAADMHSEIEKIYISAMDFTMNQRLVETVFEEIKEILLPTEKNNDIAVKDTDKIS